jgi:solute carrier family 25 folate transporter 32
MLGIFHVIIQFPLYERLKLLQRAHRDDPNTAAQIFLASTVSKVCASTATYPHEVIRTRLQLQRNQPQSAKYRGLLHAARTIAAEEGIRGFYGGLQINIIRVVPAGAITFVSYEMLLQWLNKR